MNAGVEHEMTLSKAVLSMDVSQRLSYFISLLKSDERSGDRCVALSFAICKGIPGAGSVACELYKIDLPPSFAES
jgi:hypothetical protein